MITAKVRTFANQLPVPAGFTKKIDEIDGHYGVIPEAHRKAVGVDPILQVTLTNDGIRFVMELRPTQDRYARKNYGSLQVSGHTHFLVEGRGEFTFDRRGVDDSFYSGDKLADLKTTLGDQLDRIAKSRERATKTLVLPKPLSAWSRTPEEIAKLKATVQSGGTITFTPSGFGIGYRLRAGRSKYGFLGTAPAELARFFGVNYLFYETMDCD